MDVAVVERFWAHVDRSEACWEWNGPRDAHGYGTFSVGGRSRRAHRVSWILTFGEPPPGDVLHGCDNRLCVRPGHLRLGTQQDNLADMIEKRRHFDVGARMASRLRRARTWRLKAYAGVDPGGVSRYIYSSIPLTAAVTEVDAAAAALQAEADQAAAARRDTRRAIAAGATGAEPLYATEAYGRLLEAAGLAEESLAADARRALQLVAHADPWVVAGLESLLAAARAA